MFVNFFFVNHYYFYNVIIVKIKLIKLINYQSLIINKYIIKLVK